VADLPETSHPPEGISRTAAKRPCLPPTFSVFRICGNRVLTHLGTRRASRRLALRNSRPSARTEQSLALSSFGTSSAYAFFSTRRAGYMRADRFLWAVPEGSWGIGQFVCFAYDLRVRSTESETVCRLNRDPQGRRIRS
jgi:hypothetical protein